MQLHALISSQQRQPLLLKQRSIYHNVRLKQTFTDLDSLFEPDVFKECQCAVYQITIQRAGLRAKYCRTKKMNDQEGQMPKSSNWYLSEEYLQSASTPYVEVRAIPGKGFGVFALRQLPRKFVICYSPCVVRRVDDANFTTTPYSAPVITLRNSASRVFVVDLPTNEHKDVIRPLWRGKATIGHHVNAATGEAKSNASRQTLQISPIVEGHMFYVPIVAERDIDIGSEILV